MMTDEEIIKTFWPNKICLLGRKQDKITDEVKEYLLNRYKYTESLYESLYCIKFNIDRDNQICPVCGKGILKFRGDKGRGIFLQGCSKKCIYKIRQENSINTSLQKYGVEYPRMNKKINEEINIKYKKTCQEKYGCDSATQSKEVKEKIKKKCQEKYGCDYAFQSEEVKEKIRKTCQEKYGTNWTFQNDEAKQKYIKTCQEKYGVSNSFCIPSILESFKLRKNEIQQKRDNTKRKNKTFGASIPEQKTFKLLEEKFGTDNIIRQYKSELYPFNCDFYIITLNLYIECNYFWTHQGHYFDESNEEDINTLKILIDKAKSHPFYIGAIETWTNRDLLKRNIAKNNNLNYIVFWSYNEAINWINNYEENN